MDAGDYATVLSLLPGDPATAPAPYPLLVCYGAAATQAGKHEVCCVCGVGLLRCRVVGEGIARCPAEIASMDASVTQSINPSTQTLIQAAETALKRAIALQPDLPKAWKALADLSEASGKWGEAAGALEV